MGYRSVHSYAPSDIIKPVKKRKRAVKRPTRRKLYVDFQDESTEEDHEYTDEYNSDVESETIQRSRSDALFRRRSQRPRTNGKRARSDNKGVRAPPRGHTQNHLDEKFHEMSRRCYYASMWLTQ